MFAALVASLFALLLAGHSLIRFSKENMKLRGKYIDASSHRDLLQDKLNTSQGNLNQVDKAFKALREEGDAISRSLTKVWLDYPPRQAIAKKRSPMGPNDTILYIRESLSEKQRDLAVLQDRVAENLYRTGGFDLDGTIVSQVNHLGDRWEAERANAENNKARVREHMNECADALGKLREAEEINQTLRTQRDCYLLSRNQARDDIQGLLLFMVATKHMLNQTQLDIVRDSVIGREIPSELREAKTFDDFNVLAIKYNIMQEDVVTGQPKPKTPRRRRNGS